MKPTKPSFLKRIKRKIVLLGILILIGWGAYYYYWGQYLYIVTAYCNCPICINVSKYYDGKFASGREVYWGGIAADRSVPIGSKVQLMPHNPRDWWAIFKLLKGKRDFVVEDRGGKIKGRHIDVFFSKKAGGHKAALNWGVRRMRIKINGELAK